MQVFAPLPSFSVTAEVLDQARLGKQMVECDQILRVLLEMTLDPATGAPQPREPRGWRNHPAVNAWRGHEVALTSYALAMEHEWIRRGRKPHKSVRNMELLIEHAPAGATTDIPGWWGRPDIHASHRARLLHKDYAYYSIFGWTETPRTDDEGYVWPT